MRRAVLADAGPLYASLDPDDQHHGRATIESERLSVDGYTVIVAYPTLFETYTLVSRRLGLRVAQNFASELRERAALVAPTADDYASACILPRRFEDQALSLFDTLVAVLSARLGITVWTYDRDFDVIGADVWR